MCIDSFLDLINSGFDVSFNYKDVFYTISTISDDENGKVFGIGSDNGLRANFESLDLITGFVLDDKTIGEVVSDLNEEDIYY